MPSMKPLAFVVRILDSNSTQAQGVNKTYVYFELGKTVFYRNCYSYRWNHYIPVAFGSDKTSVG